MESKVVEVRCKKCKGLLMKAEYGEVEIKCRKCGYINYLLLEPPDKRTQKRPEVNAKAAHI